MYHRMKKELSVKTLKGNLIMKLSRLNLVLVLSLLTVILVVLIVVLKLKVMVIVIMRYTIRSRMKQQVTTANTNIKIITIKMKLMQQMRKFQFHRVVSQVNPAVFLI